MSAVLHRAPPVPLLRTAVTLAAAAAGVALGSALAGDTPQSGAPAPARVALSSGPATLPLPSGWSALGRRSSLPGFEAATAVRAAGGEVAVDIRAPETASLLPEAVAADGAPRSVRRIAGRTVWRYELPGPDPGTRIVALALPTTAGVVTIACPAAVEGCEQAMAGLELDGAAPLDAGPATATAIALRATLPALNRGRRTERRRLATAESPAARRSAALRLAERHAAAAARVRPLAAGRGTPVAATLAALARDYRALATASQRRDAPAARRAGSAIARHERELARALAALQAPRSAG